MELIKNILGDSDKVRAQVWFDMERNEFRVIFLDYYGHSIPKADYHTDDRDDAIGTAQSEVVRMDALERLATARAANP